MDRKVVLVTGAAKRAGNAFVKYFCTHGYNAVVHYETSEDEAFRTVAEIEKIGGQAVAIRADLRSELEIQRLIDSTYEHFGKLDVLINNASVFWQEHFPEFTASHLDLALSINCRAPILLIQAFYLKAKAMGQEGVVINVVDQKIKNNYHKDHFSYTVGKTAIGNLTDMLAISAHPVLRVNAVFPGLMLPSDDQSEADFAHAARTSNLLGRVASPDDVASAMMLLTSPAYNGTDFVVDAGQNTIPVTQDVLYSHRAPKS